MKKILLLLLLTCVIVFGVKAETVGELNTKIAQLEKSIAEAQSQAKTLAGQIAYYDSQIELANLKIKQTEEQIGIFGTKIDLLESKLQERSTLLKGQIVQTYKKGPIDPLQVLFSVSDVSDLILRFKYLQIVQANNRKFLHDTQVVQTNYQQQKILIEASKKKLEAQKQTLASVRSQRDSLLTQTKNSESIYQKQLEQARLELEAVQRALASAVKQGPVNAGDPIGLVGNSGYPSCSTGKHLHFEARVNDTWVDAETYLQSRSVWDDTSNSNVSIGSGSWPWPLNGSVRVTQRYGKTPWSYRYAYSDGIHTGIDMTSSDDVIRAPASGTLYSSSQRCGSSTLNIKFIDHGNGLKTLYLHVQ